jgi:hypothetical protein
VYLKLQTSAENIRSNILDPLRSDYLPQPLDRKIKKCFLALRAQRYLPRVYTAIAVDVYLYTPVYLKLQTSAENIRSKHVPQDILQLEYIGPTTLRLSSPTA